MTHANAALIIEGRRRLVECCRGRPIAYVATEAGVSRACLAKWQRALDLFDAFDTKEKTLYANMGGHTGTPWFEVEDGAGSSAGT